MLGRLAGTVAPRAAGTFFNPQSNSVRLKARLIRVVSPDISHLPATSAQVLYMAGGAAFVSMIAIGCVPFETKGRHTF